MPIDPSTAFVSYSHEDSEFVLRLVKDLKAKGAKVWLDKLDIHAGQPWDEAIETAVGECEHMLVILSPVSVASQKVKNEFVDALELSKVVIPVLFRECRVPQQLKRLQYADFRFDYATGMEELVASLFTDQGKQANLGKRAAQQAFLSPALTRLSTQCIVFLALGIGSEGLATYIVGPGSYLYYFLCASAGGLLTGTLYALLAFQRFPLEPRQALLLGGSWALGWSTIAHSGFDPLAGALGGAMAGLLLVVRRRR